MVSQTASVVCGRYGDDFHMGFEPPPSRMRNDEVTTWTKLTTCNRVFDLGLVLDYAVLGRGIFTCFLTSGMTPSSNLTSVLV